MKRLPHYWLAALLLAGCASAPTPSTVPSAGQAGTPPATTVQPSVGETPAIAPEAKPEMSRNRAVVSLLERAQRDSAAGNREAAGLALERAQRIEPRNPWLWHELAQLRLTQGQYAQAITLARKSTSFAGQNRALKALNWKVIGDARVAQGDPMGAEQAYKQADALEPPAVLPSN